jgi:hypothetical protein
MLGDALMDTEPELPELDPQAVQRVLDAFDSQKEVHIPGGYSSGYAAFQEVQCVFGKSMIEMLNEEPPTKRPRMEHPAIADPCWLVSWWTTKGRNQGESRYAGINESSTALPSFWYWSRSSFLLTHPSPSSGLILMLRPPDEYFWLFFIVARKSSL